MTQLPVIDRPIDNTVLSEYMTCPRAYNYAYRMHRRPATEAAALSFGKWWHLCLETHYKTGGNGDAVEAIIQQWEEHIRANGINMADEYRTPGRLRVCYIQYLQRWNVQADLRSTIGWPENPLVEISTSVQGGGLLHPYAGKLDRVIMDSGLGYIEDHKTTSRLDTHYFTQFQKSNQMKGYTWMGQQLYPSVRVVGVRINLMHCTKTKTEFHRQVVPFPPAIIAEWVDNTNEWLRRLSSDYSTETWPGHFGDNGCSRKFGLCQFHRVCATSPAMRQSILEHEFAINPWNPLEVEDDTDA